ncbi:unnamed protein product [Sphagnum jensenii]
MPATMQKLQVPTRTLEGSCEFLLQRRRGSLLGIGNCFCGFQLSALVRNRSVFRSSLHAVGQPISSVANALVREVHVPIKPLPKGLPQEWTLHSRRAFSRSGCKKPYGTAPHVDCLRAPDSEADGQLGAKEMTLHVDSPVVEAEVSGAVLAEAPGERETASGKEETPSLHRHLDSTATASSGMDAEVPGIGPRNMEKLVAKGIAKLAELKQLYLDKFRQDGSEKMVEYLQSSVGILHKNHAESITNFIKHTVDAELGPKEDCPSVKKRLTFCVEGNISVGKSTFLQKIASETIELQDLVEIVPEPVAKWQDVGKEHHNILESFYAEPERYAYTFQNYVFVTRLMQERESANGVKPLRLMERSVFSDRMMFVRAVHEAKWMSEMEISIYDSWFNPVVSELPGLVPDAFIYLPEEQGVSLDYLRGLHEKHEQWLLPANSSSAGVLSVSPALREPMSTRICDRVFYLEGDHVHSCIQKVPALMLDCDANIDFSHDIEAKAEYAKQVAEFFEYVQRTKDNLWGPRQLLPSSGGLLGPDGSQLLSRNSIKAVDFSEQMSSYCL